MTLRPTGARTLVPALATAAVLAALPAAASADAHGITMQVRDAVIGHGGRVVVTGTAGGAAGRQLLLQHQRPGGAFTTVAAGRTREGGRFDLRSPLPVSGRVRVLERTTAAAGASSAASYVAVAARVVGLRRRADVLAGRRAGASGAVRPARGGLRVELQRRRGGDWQTVDSDVTDRRGRFGVFRRLTRAGGQRMRLRVVRTPRGIVGGERALGTVRAYRRALASWYGPGLYGNPLGCGGTLTPSTVGVAHKSLPCGTRLTLRHRGREVQARVIDRGPYAGDRELDLTEATKRRLRFSGVGAVWVAPRRAG